MSVSSFRVVVFMCESFCVCLYAVFMLCVCVTRDFSIMSKRTEHAAGRTMHYIENMFVLLLLLHYYKARTTCWRCGFVRRCRPSIIEQFFVHLLSLHICVSWAGWLAGWLEYRLDSSV